MPRWYDRAVEELEKALENGEISDAEYQREMRELVAEVRDAATEAAQAAYNDVMDYY